MGGRGVEAALFSRPRAVRRAAGGRMLELSGIIVVAGPAASSKYLMAGNQFLSILGWWFVPTVVAKLQSLLYSIFIRAGDAHPPPGSPKFIRHRKLIHALVIGAYLVYTIVEADWELQRAGDFYSALGVAPDVGERALQSKFRRLTVLHHPDKIAAAEARPQAERYYVYLTLARDTLVDPAKRFAYDRFGPDMLAWKHCLSVRDFVMHGMQSAAPSYAASAFALVVLGMLGYLEWGRYVSPLAARQSRNSSR